MKFFLAAALLHLLSARPGCVCDCCGVVHHHASFQCALIEDARFLKPFRHKGPECSGVCRKPVGDEVLSTAHDEVDYQRFCFFDCLPMRKERGATCKNLAQDDAHKRKDRSGNGVIPSEAKVDFHATFHHRAIKRHRVHHAAKNDDPWESVLRKDAKSLNDHADKLATMAEEELNLARTAEESVKKTLERNKAAIPQLLASVAEAAKAARKAFAAQKATEKIRDEVLEATHQQAKDVLEDTMRDEKIKAHVQAKKQAEEKAENLFKDMQSQAPIAAAAAMKPYNDAFARAAGISGQYQKRGDELGLESVGLQMKANMLLNQSNQWMILGQVAKAQSVLREAHETMNLAASLSAQANTLYNTAKSIMDTLGGYATEASQAAYHAEVMLNPDAPPPAPPLI